MHGVSQRASSISIIHQKVTDLQVSQLTVFVILFEVSFLWWNLTIIYVCKFVAKIMVSDTECFSKLSHSFEQSAHYELPRKLHSKLVAKGTNKTSQDHLIWMQQASLWSYIKDWMFHFLPLTLDEMQVQIFFTCRHI
jgi:hypothetical protein